MATANRATIVPRLKQRYEDEIRPSLKDELQLSSIMQAPKITKITLNMGVGEAKTDAKALDSRSRSSTTIAGSGAGARRASRSRTSSSARACRSARASRCAAPACTSSSTGSSIALPRIRDFRGLDPDSFDGRGNYSIGIKEQIIFPEIDYDSVPSIRGLDIAITTTAQDDEQAARCCARSACRSQRREGIVSGERPRSA